jgi:hypothetical protein
MGLFDKPDANWEGKISELIGLPIFIQKIEMRDVHTMYGPGTALDITILVDGEEKVYSGFAAGIKRQVQDADASEFPVWARIENKPLGDGKSTLILVPSSEDEAAQLTTAGQNDIPF